MVLTRKRAAENLRRNAIERPPSTEKSPGAVSLKSRRRATPHNSERPVREDNGLSMRDDSALRYYAALAFLEQNRMDLMCWGGIHPEDIERRTLATWQILHIANREYIRTSGITDRSNLFVATETPGWNGNPASHRQSLKTARTILFMKTIGDVLRSKVFEGDIVARCRTIMPLEESADLLRTTSPETYKALEMGRFRRQPQELNRCLVQECEEEFYQRLGAHSPQCADFLQRAVCMAIQLRLYLLHPVVVYEFDYSPRAPVFHAEAILGSRSDHWYPVLPAIRRESRTIVKAIAFYVE